MRVRGNPLIQRDDISWYAERDIGRGSLHGPGSVRPAAQPADCTVSRVRPPWERMSQDSMQCDSWARANAGSQGNAAAGGAVGGALVGAAVGAGLGAIAGSFFGMADSGAAIGAAMGGASGGLQGAADSAVAQDQRLMAAYRNCMAARGYVVDGSVPPPMPAAASSVARSSGAGARTLAYGGSPTSGAAAS